MVRTLPHGTTHFLSIFLLPASIIAKGINLSSLNAFQSLKTIKTGITSSKSSKKLCHTTNPPTALPVGVSRVRPHISGITPLTCTIFDPSFTALIYPGFRFFTLPFPAIPITFPQIGSNRAEWVHVVHFIYFCQTKAQIGSRTLTGGNFPYFTICVYSF